MRARLETKLSLYEFFTYLGMNPLHCAGIDVSELSGPFCAKPWPQYDWQAGDRVSREQVARAIVMAESQMERYLGFNVLPAWTNAETHESVQSFNTQLRGAYVSNQHQLNRRYYIQQGRRASALVEADATVTYEAASYWQDGVVTSTIEEGQDPCEIRIYYPGKAGDPTWEIRPAEVTISGTTATIRFKRECAVVEDLWDALDWEAADGEDDDDFLSEVDVYRVYSLPDEATTLVWEPRGLVCTCGQGCNGSTATGCQFATDPVLGSVEVRPGTWASSVFTAGAYTQCRRPDRVQISYLSGYRDESQTCPNKTMEPNLGMAVAYFAASLLERSPCDCTVDSWMRWREDRSRGGDVRYAVQAARPNPFGTREGAIYAWERVLEYTLGQGAPVVTG